MIKTEIIVIHKSVIVQKGLNSLIYIHQRSGTSSLINYKDIDILESIKKHIIFVDINLACKINRYITKLINNGNSIIGISDSFRQYDNIIPFKEIIYLNDSENTICKKFDRIFPAESTEECKQFLTTRENDILKQVAKGLNSNEIANKLFISRHTVITHRKNICNKLGIKTISGLTLYALVNKII